MEILFVWGSCRYFKNVKNKLWVQMGFRFIILSIIRLLSQDLEYVEGGMGGFGE